MNDDLFVGLGSDVAGEVVQAGSGVKNLKIGDKVVAYAVSFFLPFSCFMKPGASSLIRAYSTTYF